MDYGNAKAAGDAPIGSYHRVAVPVWVNQEIAEYAGRCLYFAAFAHLYMQYLAAKSLA